MVDEFDDDLRELKREIIESRGLIIKTNNLTNALSADLKSIAKRQQWYEKRLFLNSATAYIVVVVIAFILVKLAWDARVDAVRAETEQTRQALDRISHELKDAQHRDDERAKAEAHAAAYYELVKQGKRNDLVDQYEAISKEPLTKTEQTVFSDAAERARGELSMMSYHQGLEHARVGRWHEAAQAYEESLKFKDDAAHSPATRYALADAYRHLSRQREAIPMLIQLSDSSSDKEIMDDASYLLAECLIDIQAWNDAKNALRTFVRRFGDSPLLNEVKQKLADVNLHH